MEKELNIEEMSLTELEEKAAELKDRLTTEGISDEERAQINKLLKDILDRIDVLALQFEQAMWRGAQMEPPAPMM